MESLAEEVGEAETVEEELERGVVAGFGDAVVREEGAGEAGNGSCFFLAGLPRPGLALGAVGFTTEAGVRSLKSSDLVDSLVGSLGNSLGNSLMDSLVAGLDLDSDFLLRLRDALALDFGVFSAKPFTSDFAATTFGSEGETMAETEMGGIEDVGADGELSASSFFLRSSWYANITRLTTGKKSSSRRGS